MKIILNKLKNKSNRKARFVCSLTLKISKKKSYTHEGLIYGKISKKYQDQMGLAMIPFLYQMVKNNIWTNAER